MSERLSETPPIERKERLEGFKFAARTMPSEAHPSENQDFFILEPKLGLGAVFDGVGGHSNGAEAARIAAEEVKKEIESWDSKTEDRIVDYELAIPQKLKAVLRHAHETVLAYGNKLIESGKIKMDDYPSTTAAVVKLYELPNGLRIAFAATVGDSRIYVFRAASKTLKQISEDDDYISDMRVRQQLEEIYNRDLPPSEVRRVRESVDRANDEDDLRHGSLEQYLFTRRNIINASIGSRHYKASNSVLPVHTYKIELNSGDEILITSDGIHDNLKPEQIELLLRACSYIEECVGRLVLDAHEFAHKSHWKKGDAIPRAKKDDMTAELIKAL